MIFITQFCQKVGYQLPHNNTIFEATQGGKNTFLKAQNTFLIKLFFQSMCFVIVSEHFIYFTYSQWQSGYVALASDTL